MKPTMRTKILVDGGDPAETLRVKNLIGGVDGQTTNPTLVSRNPEIRELITSGHKFSREQELDEYKKIVRQIALLLGNAGVSIEVFANFDTTAEEMLAQGREMFSWIPNAYIKYPCTKEGLRAAQASVGQNIPVNMTLYDLPTAGQEIARMLQPRLVRSVYVFVNSFIKDFDRSVSVR